MYASLFVRKPSRGFMQSRRVIVFILALFMFVGTTPGVFAQHNRNAMSPGTSPDIMEQCRKQRSEMAALVDQMSETLTAGRELSNPEEMRAAIEKAESQLTEIRQHMSTCPMTNDGVTSDSGGHTRGRKCMGNRQQSEGQTRSDDSAFRR